MFSAKYKKLFSYYPFIIAALVALLCVMVWPLGLLGHTTYESTSLERGIFPNLNLSDSSILTGQFRPSHKQLDSISFRFLISGSAPEGTVDLGAGSTFPLRWNWIPHGLIRGI